MQSPLWITDKSCLHPALCPRFPWEITGTCWTIRSSGFVSWFLEESTLLRAAHSAWDAQAQWQLQPTWSRGGINSLQEKRQEKLHGMALWPELQYSGSAWFCNKLCLSQHQSYTGGGPKISSFPHLVKFMFFSSLHKFYCGTSGCECLETDLEKEKSLYILQVRNPGLAQLHSLGSGKGFTPSAM